VAAQHWYTLIRFDGSPNKLTGVAQARTPAETLEVLCMWEERFPGHTTVVFDQKNAPIERPILEWLAMGRPRIQTGQVG